MKISDSIADRMLKIVYIFVKYSLLAAM